jgi:glycosyltransferase involved in cell wall biosynthesis
MGETLWDGAGRKNVGGFIVPYEVTRQLSKYFECDMIFETDEKENLGKLIDTGRGFKKGYLPKQEGAWRLDEDYLKRYDLIHVWGSSHLFTYRAYTKTFVPLCHTLHSAISMTNWARLASAFLVPGHDTIALGSSCLVNALYKFWKAPVEIIPFGVNTELFKPMDKNSCRERLNIPKESIVLGYLGRIGKLDFVFSYETMRKVAEMTGRKDIILVTTGGHEKFGPLYVKKDLVYLKYLEKSEVPVMLNSCDIFFNPIAGAWEGFGLSVIEAMACEVPVVTTHWNGYTDTVTERKTGFLARTCWKDGDVWINQKDLVQACACLIEDESLRYEMGKKARNKVKQNYTWEQCINRYREKFYELINNEPPKDIQYSEAPERIDIVFDDIIRSYSLKEAYDRMDELCLDFKRLHEDFVSNRRMRGAGWKRVVCRDNIINFPKYSQNRKKAFNREQVRIEKFFPKLDRMMKYQMKSYSRVRGRSKLIQKLVSIVKDKKSS